MTELRDLLGDVAERAKTYDVLDVALRRGRRRRTVRPFLAVATTMIAVVAAAAGTVALLHRQRPVEPAMTGPTTLYYGDGTTVLYTFGGDAPTTPVGLVLNHVLSELSTGDTPWHGQSWDQIRDANLKITTTIDARAQAVLEQAADATVAGSPMNGQPDNLATAGVLVQPGTGRVLAYYGGHDGTGNDLAGYYYDEQGQAAGFGEHPAGGTFMAYTLAAALKAGYSLNSRWQWTPHDQLGRPAELPIRDAAVCSSDLAAGRTPETGNCSLSESVQNSLNIPLYDVTASLGADKVLSMARDAGVQTIWNDERRRLDLTAPDGVARALQNGIGLEVGIGQYAVTVLDQANAMATFAAGGVAAQAHFVRTVTQRGRVAYAERLPDAGAPPVLSSAQLADLSSTLSSQPSSGGVATKTGAWQFAATMSENAHAWDIGYTSVLAGAIWVGPKADAHPLIDKDGNPIWGSTLPHDILLAALQQAQARLGLTPVPFGPAAGTGNEHPPGSR
jgi:membrane peptidoglycan carboxypeptidase